MIDPPTQPSSQSTPSGNGGNGRELRDKVIETQTRLQYCATKEELQGLRTDIERGNNSFLRWLIGTALTCIGLGAVIARILMLVWPP